MEPWRAARSLETLRDQINATQGLRAKGADGTIGDAAHAASVSDHNPDAQGIVRALDVTEDPDDHDGDPRDDFDAGALAEQLRLSRDPRLKYVIWNRRIFSSTVAPWTWRTYTGTDPHTNHVHISVVPDSRADDITPWKITQQEDDMTPEQEAKLDEVLRRVFKIETEYADLVPEILRRVFATQQAVSDPAALAAKLAPMLAGPDGNTVTDEQLEAALRKVLGSLDQS